MITFNTFLFYKMNYSKESINSIAFLPLKMSAVFSKPSFNNETIDFFEKSAYNQEIFKMSLVSKSLKYNPKATA